MDRKIGKVLAIVLAVAMVFGSLNLTTAVFAEENIEAPVGESIDDAPTEENIEALAEESIDDALAEESIDDALVEEGIEAPAEESIDDAFAEEGIAVLTEDNPTESTEEQNTEEEINVSSADDLINEVENATTDKIIRLTGTSEASGEVVFGLEKTLKIPSQVSITIKGAEGTTCCLRAISVTDAENGAVINIPQGSTLNLENIVIDANGKGRVVYNAGTLSVTSSSLENGKLIDALYDVGEYNDAGGIGIFNSETGSVTLKGDAVVKGNTASMDDGAYCFGAGIYNEGSITLEGNTVVKENTVNMDSGECYGVGIYNVGEVTLKENAIVESNSATLPYNIVHGVGICNGGSLIMTGSSAVKNNSVPGSKEVYGVGICNGGDGTSGENITLKENATVQNNSSGSASSLGVGIYNQGTLTMEGSSAVQGNLCTGTRVYGVGIDNEGTLTMDTDTVVKNNIYQPTNAASNGYGIGICNMGSSSNLELAGTICENQAIADDANGNVTVSGIGLYQANNNSLSTFTMSNGSIINNKASGDFGTGSVLGVGCFLNSTKTYLYGGTITNNDFLEATSETKSGAGVYAKKSLTIGGKLQIMNNNTNNLYLDFNLNFDLDNKTGDIITVGQEMEEGAEINITYGNESTISASKATNVVSLINESEGEYFSYTSVNQDGDEPSYKVGIGKDENEKAYFQIISTKLVQGSEEKVSNEEELITALANAGNDPTHPTIIKLQNDIKITRPLNIILDRQVQITSIEGDEEQHNYKLYIGETEDSMSTMLTIAGSLTLSNVTLDASEKARVVSVSEGADVTIDNGATVTGGYLSYTNAKGAGLNIARGASATLKDGGSITGNKASTVGLSNPSQFAIKGIGVYNAGKFTMTGGSITNNTVTDETMSSGDEGVSGGALYNDGTTVAGNPATFQITGGTISKNTVTNYGGAIYNDASTTNKLDNVTIENNQAMVYHDVSSGRIYYGTNGGAIYTKAGTINISGKTAIKRNSAINGGGVFVTGSNEKSYGTVTMNDADTTIVENETVTEAGYGAGVFVDSGIFTLNAGTISGNKIPDTDDESEWYQGLGGGIFVNGNKSHASLNSGMGSDVTVNPATLELFGGEITGNTAINGGSGIYVSNIAYQYTAMRDEKLYIYGAALVNVKGSPVVKGNIGDDIRLASAERIEEDTSALSEQMLTLMGALESTAELNVSKKIVTYEDAQFQEAEDKVFAVAGEDYSLTDTDVNAISCQALNDDLYQIMKEPADGGTGYKSIYASKVDLSSFTVTLEQDTYTYTGSEIEPTVSVTFGDESLIKDEDYTVSYKNNKNVGDATVIIAINKDSLTGSITKEFQITPKVLTDSADAEPSPLTLGTEPITYNGKEQLPSITVKDGENTLVEGTDYEVSCEDCITPGEKTLTVTGIGNYEGTSLTGTFTIEKASIAAATVTGLNNAVYTGSAITCALTVTADGNTLKENTDYTVKYDNNINVGTATVTITGTGNYTGTITRTFAIAKANQTISGVNKSYTQTYSKNGMTLKATAKTMVSYSSSKKSVATIDSKTGKITYVGAGTTTIIITAAGTSNYNQATTTVTLTVNRAKQTIAAKVANKAYKVSKLKKKKATFNIGAKSSGNGTLKYTVSKYPKKAKKFISVTKKGKVTMKKKAPKGTYKITVTANQTNQYNKATKTVTVKVK